MNVLRHHIHQHQYMYTHLQPSLFSYIYQSNELRLTSNTTATFESSRVV